MTRASALRSSVATGTLLRIAILAVAGTAGLAAPADAARYWGGADAGYSSQRDVQPQRRQTRARRSSPKKEIAVKDTTVHPQMPLVINVSIAKQRVRVYDANGLFAESPVSTGMAGHATPMGVFSVIEKDRYHHSNIYSGAPMPYMQRITWGGVALHEGVLPGYPASHGCIRMPGSFAVKMWGWTKMGARVIVSPSELAPESFSHALLPTMKVPPAPVAEQVDAPLGTKADKGAPELMPANLELRASVGHNDGLKPAEAAPLRDQTHTADASGEARGSAPTMSDATSGNAATGRDADAKSEIKSETANAESGAKAEAAAETVKDASNTGPDNAATSKRADAVDAGKSTGTTDGKSTVAETAVAPESRPAQPEAVRSVEATSRKADATETKVDTTKADPAKADATKAATAKQDAAKADASKTDTAKTDTTKADAAKTSSEPVKAANDATPPADAKKDQTRIGNKPVKQEARRKDGFVAVFISRKDGKLYVRQGFAPLFEVPVTIAADERPLGTHVFTAELDKNDSNTLHWTVVTVPQSARAAMRDSDEPRSSRRRKGKAEPVVEAKPGPLPDSAAEALDRITIPADVMAKILDGMTTGGSIIVSDQGIKQGETGEYTDFIVRTY